ncbi:hypothetical protein [Spiroplasma cantharicola]|uniref:Uncharacterized protein n=1 Tax=Spiroplasma cantharicola TaxID=362837 RepID=A0A0M4JSU2_9MOLU|nr:hypothetical protein [Spiroplasma cantharicola]ALD66509.1 hypothetical protein SCANT_v1c06030 [Spiroplasma cantharicola]
MKKEDNEIKVKEKKNLKKYFHNWVIVLGILTIISYVIYFTILWEEWGGTKNLFGDNNSTMLLIGLSFLITGSFIYGSNRKNFSAIKWIIYTTLFFIAGILLNSIPGFILWSLLLIFIGLEIVFNVDKFKELKKGKKNEIRKDQ